MRSIEEALDHALNLIQSNFHLGLIKRVIGTVVHTHAFFDIAVLIDLRKNTIWLIVSQNTVLPV